MDIFEQLKSSKLSGIQKLVSDNAEETQILEFKQLFDLSSKQGKKQISKHITGMANGAGGVFVIGVGTKKKNGIDVADSLHEIADVENYAQQLKGMIGLYSSPQIENMIFDVIDAGKTDKSGFVILSVPLSNLRPHMATAADEKRYYRRGLDGTFMMDHQQIKEMFLALRDASLNLEITPRWSLTSYPNLGINFDLELQNSGRVVSKNPFVRVKYLKLPKEAYGSPYKFRKNGNIVSYFLVENPILHVGESMVMASPRMFIVSKNGSIRSKCAGGEPNPWLQNEVWDLRYSRYNPSSVVPSFVDGENPEIVSKLVLEIEYGSENSVITKRTFEFDVGSIIEKINENGALDDWGRKTFRTFN